ncbi:hypothetical protein GLX30_25740 [Streptomyces sp. Tu 2975]|uniref:hypothetical protein n=1 Tax=Streptomyces sp. Tu 2975 TaxID=2676871 RepID=UPI00135A6CC6|nr:hypothetical protein [Streptomyces sp. Tu 2975]QIP82726.1 hypothetical protein GLX30_25740 [Streptomyces sp. Tu 2975]
MLAAAAAAIVLRTACSGGAEKEQTPAHPVFDASLNQQPHYWFTWPGEDGWGEGGVQVAGCYVLSR